MTSQMRFWFYMFAVMSISSFSFSKWSLMASRWRAEMAGRPAGNESFGFTATAADGTIALTDTVYGDVWICSGQVKTKPHCKP